MESCACANLDPSFFCRDSLKAFKLSQQKTLVSWLRMRLISAIMNFYWSHTIALQKLSNERSYKFSRILTLTEVMSIRIMRMRIIFAIIFFGPMLFPFKNCPMNVLISLTEF